MADNVSKVNAIRSSLTANPDVILVEVREKTRLTKKELNRTGYGNIHLVDFCVAPTRPTLEVDVLNRFLDNLFPEPKRLMPFERFRDDDYDVWGCYTGATGLTCLAFSEFDEVVGSNNLRRYARIDDGDLAKDKNVVNGEIVLEEVGKDLLRNIRIVAYPNEEITRELISRGDHSADVTLYLNHLVCYREEWAEV